MIAKPHSDGLFYIAQLLRHPGRVLSATVLRELHAAWRADPQGWLRGGAAAVVLTDRRDEEGDPDALRL